VILQTQAHVGIGERFVLHTNPDLAVMNRDEFAAQHGVEADEIQVLPVRLSSMADLVVAKGSQTKGIKLVCGWNPAEFGTITVNLDDMAILKDALGEKLDISMTEAYKIVQNIIGPDRGGVSGFEHGLADPPLPTLPTYRLKENPSIWSRLSSLFRK